MFGRSVRAYSMPLKRSISPALVVGCEPGTPISLARISVHQRLVGELAQLRAQRVGARRHQLREELRGDPLRRSDPEAGAREPAPGELAGRAQLLRLGRVEDHRETQTEAHA